MKPLRFWPSLFLLFVAAANDVPRKVTVQELLATPTKFNGTRVDLTGYYHVGTEENALFANVQAAVKAQDTDTSIHLDTSKLYAGWPRLIDQAANHIVRVIGVFHYRKLVIIERNGGIDAKSTFGYGHLGMYEREIDNIRYIQRIR